MLQHNYGYLAATVHAAAGMPNFIITEYFVNFEELGQEIAQPPIVARDGYIEVPQTPGLGIALDEQALAAHPYQAFPPRKIGD